MFDLAKDINIALAYYPNLKQSNWQGGVVVEGTFIAHSKEDGTEIDTYEIRIEFTSKYPFAFPKVTETGLKIQPRNETRHIFPQGHLCLGNEFDEARVCKSGISLKWFLDEILNPHLCREYVRDHTGKYPTGERSHNMEGLWESFYEIFKTNDKSKILLGLSIILEQKPGRNNTCPCGSNIKYKHCHQRFASLLFEASVNKVLEFYTRLKKHYNETI